MTEVAYISIAVTLNKLCKNIPLPIIQVLICFVEKENVLFDPTSTPIPCHRAARNVTVQHLILRMVINIIVILKL